MPYQAYLQGRQTLLHATCLAFHLLTSVSAMEPRYDWSRLCPVFPLQQPLLFSVRATLMGQKSKNGDDSVSQSSRSLLNESGLHVKEIFTSKIAKVGL